MATQAVWKPDRAEAQFLGELLNIDADLAQVARGMLAGGQRLQQVADAFKAAMEVVAVVRGAQARTTAAEPFPQSQRRDGKEPCGECRLPKGETCDICGAAA